MTKLNNTPEAQAQLAAAMAAFMKTAGAVVQCPPQSNPRQVTAK